MLAMDAPHSKTRREVVNGKSKRALWAPGLRRGVEKPCAAPQMGNAPKRCTRMRIHGAAWTGRASLAFLRQSRDFRGLAGNFVKAD
jgi:hypothetical protein